MENAYADPQLLGDLGSRGARFARQLGVDVVVGAETAPVRHATLLGRARRVRRGAHRGCGNRTLEPISSSWSFPAPNADGTTTVDPATVRDGKNFEGRFFAVLFAVAGKHILGPAFENGVKAIERRPRADQIRTLSGHPIKVLVTRSKTPTRPGVSSRLRRFARAPT